MIEVNNLSFSYLVDKPVLNNITFSLEKGSTMAIVGSSGCSKSTLLRIFSGILPSANSACFAGNILISKQNPKEYMKLSKLAFMFQNPPLMPNLTLFENVALPLEIRGNFDFSIVDNIINLVGLNNYKHLYPKHLSGGMKTRVDLARSFISKPDLLLLDEPFSALDIVWKAKLYKELKKLQLTYNATIVLVTHDIQEALLLANKVLVLNKEGFLIEEISIREQFSFDEKINGNEAYYKTEYLTNFLKIQQILN